METRRQQLDTFQDRIANNTQFMTPATLVYTIAAAYIVHYLLLRFDYPILSLTELFWNALVYATPARLLLDSAKRQELEANNMHSHTHAAKSEALRQALGLGGGAIMSRMPAGMGSVGEGVVRRMSMGAKEWANLARRSPSPGGKSTASGVPPGLGNWDNSCYQNSVLQGLSSLRSLRSYLSEERMWAREAASGTRGTLLELIAQLQDGEDNGRMLWTPAKLKSMSSWQQQDAQEYFSKIMDELEKEAVTSQKRRPEKGGLESAITNDMSAPDEACMKDTEETIDSGANSRNPLDGLLAQRVTCTKCGFSEGLSMIPFNCITIPLGSAYSYDLAHCLDEYTKLEDITEVDCTKCTLLTSERQMQKMAAAPLTPRATPEPRSGVDEELAETNAIGGLALPPEIRVKIMERLCAIRKALDEEDFDDKTVKEKCQIPKAARVSGTKTRQAVIGRAPQSLAIHVNRSVFDEMTGAQRKNYAAVRYPAQLELAGWMLGGGAVGTVDGWEEKWRMNARSSMLDSHATPKGSQYRLQAVVTHYGRHENGHYIAYRRHEAVDTAMEQGLPAVIEGEGVDGKDESLARTERWWRLSDEDVSAVSETDVLSQGGVFMLFYERENIPQPPHSDASEPLAIATAALTGGPALPIMDTASDRIPQTSPRQGAAIAKEALLSTGDEDQTFAGAKQSASSEAAAHRAGGTETEPGFEVEDQKARLSPTPPTPPAMRTARGRHSVSEKAFAGGFRPMAAT